MATITGMTAERMLEIEAASVVDGDIVGDDLFLTRKDGTPLNAGNVRGPRGADGPMGHPLVVLSAQQVLDVGMANQIRAGRQLTPADFTNLGLSVPVGLWNLATLADASGNGRNLSNKGAVPFGPGILGAAVGAAQFAGSTGQALYIPDGGTADPFRIKTGAVGSWCRSARRGVAQWTVSKYDDTVAGRRSWMVGINTNNVAQWNISSDGTAGNTGSVVGTTDIADDKWHFIVGTFDGSRMKIYVDGVLEGTANFGTAGAPIFGTAAPLNIGGYNGDGTATTTGPFFGSVDEAFVLAEVPSDADIRNLYAANIPHALGAVPTNIGLSVRRKRRGAPLPAAAFPAQPLRLHNFVGGVLTDQGSQNVPLVLGAGAALDVAAPDGSGPMGGKHITSAAGFLTSTDTGLPAALASRSYGAWFKVVLAQNAVIIGWGGTGATMRTNVSGQLGSDSGADLLGFSAAVTDGNWHFGVVVENNAALDGAKRKLYYDGRVIGTSLVMNTLTLAGAQGLRVGNGFIGEVSRAFVYNGALTSDQVRALYNVGSQQLAPKLLDSTARVEAVETARILAVLDTVEATDLIDLSVM